MREHAHVLKTHTRKALADTQQTAVFEWLNPPKDRVVSIPHSSYSDETSALLDVLHPGSGKGRLSTAEAVAKVVKGMGVEEAVKALTLDIAKANEAKARRMSTALKPDEATVKVPARTAGVVPPVPLGLRHCDVCNVTLSSWKRRNDHFLGSRHTSECLRLGLVGEKGWEVVRAGRVEAVDRVWEEMEIEEGLVG